MKLKLHRDWRADDCTQGVLSLSTPTEDLLCQTIERPWVRTLDARGGRVGVSCVPTGVYRLERHNSEAHPNTWALVNSDLDVIHYEDPQRPLARCLVLIHVANFARELRGCIGVGFGRAVDEEGVRMVTNSRRALIELKRLLPWTDEHTLEIT